MTRSPHSPPSTTQNPASIGVLIKADTSPAGGPCDRASTRLMAQWSDARVPLLYCTLEGIEQEQGQLIAQGWRPCEATNQWLPQAAVPLCAIYNRYPLQQAPKRLAQLAAKALACGVPIANHPALQTLVSDKWQTQQTLTQSGLPMPEASLEPMRWAGLLHTWQRAYLKPRYGAFGEGITLITCTASPRKQPSATAEVTLEGPTPGTLRRCPMDQLLDVLTEHTGEDLCTGRWLLQRAIAPPLPHWRGFCIRSLVQQTHSPTNEWRALVRVARASEDDPVANVARHAAATPLDDLVNPPDAPLPKSVLAQLDALDKAIPLALQGALAPLPAHSIVELGIDYLIDPQHKAWVLEINGFPQGRLAKLAAHDPKRFQHIFQEVREQPLETLFAYSKM